MLPRYVRTCLTCDFGKLRCADDMAWGLTGEEAAAEFNDRGSDSRTPRHIVITAQLSEIECPTCPPKPGRHINPDREHPDRFPNDDTTHSSTTISGTSTRSAEVED